MATLDDDAKALVRRPVYAWVTTLRKDGSPHNTVVWADIDGDDIIFNTAYGRVKEKHISADPRVSVSILDPDNGFHTLSVSGTATLEPEGADDVIDKLANKYLGVPTYPMRTAAETRVTVRVHADKILYTKGM